jgi:DNA/RNA endonuclease YhcR with UshA esterase domain
MKHCFLFLLLAVLTLKVSAQYPLRSVFDIQNVSGANLSNCVDSSSYNGDTVRVRGVVVMDAKVGSVVNSQIANGRNTWIQVNGGGPWSGLDLVNFTGATTTTDMLDLVAGDSIEVTGYVEEFQGETEIVVLSSVPSVTLLGSGHAVNATPITIDQLNDASRNNVLSTGEQYEGVYVELSNLTVTAVNYFSGNTRVSYDVTDASGGVINVSDRFLYQRMPGATPNPGTFVAPTVGDAITTLRGIIIHSKNNCPGNNGRGFEIHPFKSSDVVFGAQAPTITNIQRNPTTPTSSQTATITANVTANGTNTLTSVTLHYAVGVSNTTYTPVAMTNTSGNIWSGSIPAQANGSFVKYYISATDNLNLTATVPSVPAPTNAQPLFYTVNDNGTTIYDIQYTPFTNGNSGLRDQVVTVTGVVTASANDLGYVFIQQEGLTAWAGIMCIGTGLGTVNLNDKITVTGTVKEDFGMTRLENISSVTMAGTGSITPLQLRDTSFAVYGFNSNEQYEGMLVSIIPTSGTKVKVVDVNCDDSTNPATNFGEYRLGSDTLAPNTGTRVLAGRQSSSAFSSLNVPFVNSANWQTTDGTMNVTPVIVTTGMEWDYVNGIMYYSFSNMKLLPRNAGDFAGVSSRQNDLLANLSLYPNPAMDQVLLSWSHLAEEAVTCSVMDIHGRVVSRSDLSGSTGNLQLSVSELPNGMYFCVIRGRDAQQVLKLQVNH